ncbi:MAG: hypothetical protein JWO69_1330 [Thermoleophilia bacterium]|jgi:hypothetical protein|nr:hypothetical protein [Thermoleophilia bacterium]
MTEINQLPEHVSRIIRRDEIEFTPPTFERWLGRLQMLRTLSAMGGFFMLFLISYEAGLGWESSTVRGIVAAIAFHFIAWALGLFVFGELYDSEVKLARAQLEERERDRARRIEEYYRERLLAQGMLTEDSQTLGGDTASGADATTPLTPPTSLSGRPAGQQQQQQRAA